MCVDAVGMESHAPRSLDSMVNRVKQAVMLETDGPHLLRELVELIDTGRIDPSFVVTHTAPLEQGPGLYKTFRDKADGCIKVVLKP